MVLGIILQGMVRLLSADPPTNSFLLLGVDTSVPLLAENRSRNATVSENAHRHQTPESLVSEKTCQRVRLSANLPVIGTIIGYNIVVCASC